MKKLWLRMLPDTALSKRIAKLGEAGTDMNDEFDELVRRLETGDFTKLMLPVVMAIVLKKAA